MILYDCIFKVFVTLKIIQFFEMDFDIQSVQKRSGLSEQLTIKLLRNYLKYDILIKILVYHITIQLTDKQKYIIIILREEGYKTNEIY